MHNEFTAIFEKDEEWFIVFCTEIQGANWQGKTLDECRKSLFWNRGIVTDFFFFFRNKNLTNLFPCTNTTLIPVNLHGGLYRENFISFRSKNEVKQPEKSSFLLILNRVSQNNNFISPHLHETALQRQCNYFFTWFSNLKRTRFKWRNKRCMVSHDTKVTAGTMGYYSGYIFVIYYFLRSDYA